MDDKIPHRVLGGPVGREVVCCIRGFMLRLQCEMIELNVQPDHVHMVAWMLPRLSVSEVMGTVKGKTAIHVFRKFPWLKRRLYWGNHFWAEGLLCGHDGARRGDNQALCKMAGGKGAS